MQRNILSVRHPVPIAPDNDVFPRTEGEHHRAMLMNVLPSLGRGDGEVYPHVLQTDRLTLNDPDDQRLSLGSDPGVDSSLASHEGGDAEGTPNAWSPPIAICSLNPVRRWSDRKRVNQPRFANMRVQNNSVDLG
jgi:hypothetical protein